MSFSERTGDMFQASDLDALAHGVNCKGVMGGIAGTFAQKYPDMEKHYKGLCDRGELETGQIFPWQEEGKPMVYNLATQENPGSDAKYKHVKKTMRSMLNHAEATGINKIGVPQIGCGIGGLDWDRTRNIIKNISSKSPVEVVAYTYEPPKRNPSPIQKNKNISNPTFYDQDKPWWNTNDDWFKS
jgi:O-acetyl-ADP-ribose deacetylase (regulator of RNase III)